MLKRIVFAIFFFLFLTGYDSGIASSVPESEILLIYLESRLINHLPYEVFEMAVSGMNRSASFKVKDQITIIDYSRPSGEERLYIIDLKNKKLLYKSLVAHGMNSGEAVATSFSNMENSYKSCLGFHVAAETYFGKHGFSLRLDGLEPGINDNARSRAIVIHGAAYVSTAYLEKHGRLGRSWGCPALPLDSYEEIIKAISPGSCIFIYADNKDYLNSSLLINHS